MKTPKKFPSVDLADVDQLSAIPGIYFAMDGDYVLYVGQSENIKKRWSNHHRHRDIRQSCESVRIHFTPSDGRPLVEQENEWIKECNPPFNGGRMAVVPLTPPDRMYVPHLIAVLLLGWFGPKFLELAVSTGKPIWYLPGIGGGILVCILLFYVFSAMVGWKTARKWWRK